MIIAPAETILIDQRLDEGCCHRVAANDFNVSGSSRLAVSSSIEAMSKAGSR
jgi:hypothetical protein